MHSVNALSRSCSIACAVRQMLQLISMEIDETLSDSPAESIPILRGGVPSRPVQSQIHLSLICFPNSEVKLLSSPLLSGDVWEAPHW